MHITPDTEVWERLQELFHQAESLPSSERERVLHESGASPELQARVRALLRSAERYERHWHSVAEPLSSPPKKMGPYTLINRIGSGGTGTVYLAERDAGEVRQRVALKMLAPHAAGPSFVERFHREQKILALLDHPNITRMLDAGIDDEGHPYLVMEFVDGEQIDLFCDGQKLGVEQRLRLFLSVCDAVDYAHRNLVVHLDLKPSNILVSANGAPKLLDFGTSKLLAADGRMTSTLALTPSYASPEQLRNEPVSTACDIYSLGVVLYELLSGQRLSGESSFAAVLERKLHEPAPAKANANITRKAAEQRSTTVSRLRGALSGDLSTIVNKCLRSAPRDRYASAAELAGDIRRFLNNRPILARPQTTLYFLRKYVRRNAGRVAAAGVMLVVLVTSTGYAFWQQRKAVVEGHRSLQMQTFLYRLFQVSRLNDSGKPAETIKEFLKLGIKTLPEYIHDPADLRQAQLSLAESMYQRRDYRSAQAVFKQVMASAHASGDVPTEAEATAYAGSTAFSIGDVPDGMTLSQKALDLSHNRGVPPRTRVLSAIFYATNREDLGHHTAENVRLLEEAVKESRAAGLPPHETGEALMQLGGIYALAGRLDEAQVQIEEGLRANRQDPLGTCEQSDLLGWLADILFQREKVAESLPVYQQSYDSYRACAGPADAGTLSEGANWAGALAESGNTKEAISMLEEALPVWQKAYGRNNFRMIEIYYFLSLAYVDAGRYADAARAAAESVAAGTGSIAPDDRSFGMENYIWARALAGQQRYSEALPHARFAVDILSRKSISPAAKEVLHKAQLLLAETRKRAAAQ